MMHGIHVWIIGGALAFLSLPSGAGGTNCQVETSTPGPEVGLIRHLGEGCTEQEREARAVDVAQLLKAFKEGKGIDLSGVVIRGDLSLDALPVAKLPPELEGARDLQGFEARVIPGSMKIVNSVVRGTIRHGSTEGLLVVKGPLSMTGSRFEQLVDLSRSIFIQPVTLSGAQFLRESYFVQGRFLRGLDAENTIFGPHTRFHRSVFQGPVTFRQSKFTGLAEFLEVAFEKDADLSRSSFTLGTGFSGSRFQGQADFSEATFSREAYFTFTLFDKDASFRGTTFRSTADFSDASFKGRDDLAQARFDKSPELTRTARVVSEPVPQVGESRAGLYAIAIAIATVLALVIVYVIRPRTR